MMCHPTTGDLLHSRADRILPRVRIRCGLRAGSDVLDLHGRIQSSRAGRLPAPASGTSGEATGSASEANAEVVIPEQHAVAEQHCGPVGVESSKPARRVSQATTPRGKKMTQPGSSLTVPVTSVLSSAPCAFKDLLPAEADLSLTRFDRLAAVGVSRRNRSIASPSFRCELQKIAGGEQIPTGVNRTVPARSLTQASVIVWVTSSGNVTVRAN